MIFLRKTFPIICILLLFSCKKESEKIEITAEDYHKVTDKLTSVMVHDIFSPPVASRVYVYPNIAAYEVLNSKDSKYNSLVSQLNGLTAFTTENNSNNVDKKLAALIAYLDVAKELVFSKEKIELYRDSLFTVWKNRNENAFLSAKE